MNGPRFLVPVLVVLIVLSIHAGMSPPVAAQDRAPRLPDDCWSGQLVVARSGGEFECVDVDEALRLSGCDSGDFVGVNSSGRLACISPSSTSWDVRGLLPDCSSGNMLVSEGFGRWRCAEPPAD